MKTDAYWCLKDLRVTDLLGFQKTVQFSFEAGLQVIEAPNHTGKTSLTMALLWGLKGVVPNLARINRQSFRLTNKHVGDNAKPFVQITLSQAEGKKLVIKRSYQPRPNIETDLTVDFEDQTFIGQQAQDLIWSELGLKPESLEGCGVVLQDHRLGLITGKDSDVSDVINDMLGLYTLSQLVPTLEASSREAAELRRDVETFLQGADPVAKWEERDKQLNQDLQQLENQALDSGLSKELLDDPKVGATSELSAAAQVLGVESPRPDGAVDQDIERLRGKLNDLRKAQSTAGALAKLESKKTQLDQLVSDLRKLGGELTEHDKRLITESGNGEIDPAKLASSVAEKEAGLEQNKLDRQKLQDEQGFLTTCYDHLLSHHAGNSCPLCLQSMEKSQLLAGLKSRLDGSIAIGLERLQREHQALTEQTNTQEKRLKAAKTLRIDHDRLMLQVGDVGQRARKEIDTWPEPLQVDDLYLDGSLRAKLLQQVEDARGKLSAEQEKVEAEIQKQRSAYAKQETEKFQPAETWINRVADHLKPIIHAAEKIEVHGKLRQHAEERRSELDQLLKEVSDTAGQLKKISGALADHEQNAASAAVKAQLPQISELFKKIAGNPDYDGLDIQTTISREKVTYKIQATSSQMGNLNDSVGHVLSEGDLSSAGVSLILGLASGQSHKMGFVLLDDPAQGMDETLQSNFASALAELDSKRQVVVLTHQRSFAEALEKRGAKHSRLSGWKLGKLQNA
jgi:hypothetical protein